MKRKIACCLTGGLISDYSHLRIAPRGTGFRINRGVFSLQGRKMKINDYFCSSKIKENDKGDVNGRMWRFCRHVLSLSGSQIVCGELQRPVPLGDVYSKYSRVFSSRSDLRIAGADTDTFTGSQRSVDHRLLWRFYDVLVDGKRHVGSRGERRLDNNGSLSIAQCCSRGCHDIFGAYNRRSCLNFEGYTAGILKKMANFVY